MTLPTIEDIKFLIHILTAVDPQYPVVKGTDVASRLRALLNLYEKKGMIPIEVSAVGILRVDDEDTEHYEEISVGDTREVGHTLHWLHTVKEITIISRKKDVDVGTDNGSEAAETPE